MAAARPPFKIRNESVGRKTPVSTRVTSSAPTALQRRAAEARISNPPKARIAITISAFSAVRFMVVNRRAPSGGAAGASVEKR